MRKVGEFDLIQSLSKKISTSSRVINGIGDDAAVLRYSSTHYQLLATDMIVEGVHFTSRMPARYIGRKALAVNISDVAAMGGIPKSAVITLGVPKGFDIDFIKACYQGLIDLAQQYDIDIVGGDTVAADTLMINVALTGLVPQKQVVLRSGARPKDWIFVSGPLGGSLKSAHHLRFEPRLKESRYLAQFYRPSSMIDISDGLASDIKHICSQSNVGVILYKENIPRREKCFFEQAMTEGEDFELLFTLPPTRAKKMLKNTKYAFHHIGYVTSQDQGMNYIDDTGKTRALIFKGYDHLI